MTSRACSLRSTRLPSSDWKLQIQQPRRIAAEDRPARRVVEPEGALDEADRVNLAHVGRVVGADENVVGAVFVDEVLELVMGVDQRVEIEALEVRRRHLLEMR